MNIIKKTFQYGSHEVTLETGRIARQADSAVLVTMGDTVVLVTVVAKRDAAPGQDFFPLTVNYQEKTYAVGKIPGGYFKREGRPSEFETLTCRLIDRPIRPLFPEGFVNEIQVIATVMSLDTEITPDIPAMIGTSAALALSGVPFKGPIGAARVGYNDGSYLLNPGKTELEASELDLVVAGTETAVLMVESEAKELSEEIMLGAVMFGHQRMQAVIKAINEMKVEAGTVDWEWTPPVKDETLFNELKSAVFADLSAAYQMPEKTARQDRIAEIKEAAITQIAGEGDDADARQEELKKSFKTLEKDIVRERVLSGEPRIDGRDTKTVRPITIETGVLPRAHGSALFTRGETQAIVVLTLGSDRDAQIIDALPGEYRDRFMLHYNFPPYSVGETGFMSGPKRREIGHGRLARRSLEAVLPTDEEFPYVMRIVSEITESNGSSSMASVCGGSLAMMDAGVPTKGAVSGIAMGLVKDGDRYAVLSDILGDEDHLGDMDFKVAGTQNGLTALQMDIKIDGITETIMKEALEQAHEGRAHILGKMVAAIDAPRQEMSAYAPRILSLQINPEKIRDVIGKGGSVIRGITEETGAVVDITDDGLVKISSVDQAAGEAALKMVKDITAEAEVGKTYEGKVAKIADFGAFVTILPGKDGLVHISQICEERVQNVSDKLSEGQVVRVKVLEIDKQGRIRLSMKEVEEVPSE